MTVEPVCSDYVCLSDYYSRLVKLLKTTAISLMSLPLRPFVLI